MNQCQQTTTYGQAIVTALVQQSCILILAALMLDFGRLLRAISSALIVSWLLSLIVMLCYRNHPTPLRIAVVKYGFWLVIVVLFLLARPIGFPIFDV